MYGFGQLIDSVQKLEKKIVFEKTLEEIVIESEYVQEDDILNDEDDTLDDDYSMLKEGKSVLNKEELEILNNI